MEDAAAVVDMAVPLLEVALWPVVVLLLVWGFRKPIGKLLNRLGDRPFSLELFGLKLASDQERDVDAATKTVEELSEREDLSGEARKQLANLRDSLRALEARSDRLTDLLARRVSERAAPVVDHSHLSRVERDELRSRYDNDASEAARDHANPSLAGVQHKPGLLCTICNPHGRP